jgi:acetate kinase
MDAQSPQQKHRSLRAFLTLNAGSSSLKLALFPEEGDNPLATALADRIGPDGVLTVKDSEGRHLETISGPLDHHETALDTALLNFRALYPSLSLIAVGHRVVHGGTNYAASVIVTEALVAELDALRAFAPLHQPHNVAGIRAATKAFPSVPQIACFDTGFHSGHSWINDTFALPRELYERGVRRYGFHGLSYTYVASELTKVAPAIAQKKIVIAHLGNGASLCAIEQGRSVTSTMGFSTLEGLPMGTRCGRIDPGVLLYLLDEEKMTSSELSALLYKRSGLLALSGLSNDMRTLESSDHPNAKQAINYFVASIQREIASCAATLGGLDALVFCGGIGENSRLVRESVCSGLGWMGLGIDAARNAANETFISGPSARIPVIVIPTNEELVIAREARLLVAHASS